MAQALQTKELLRGLCALSIVRRKTLNPFSYDSRPHCAPEGGNYLQNGERKTASCFR